MNQMKVNQCRGLNPRDPNYVRNTRSTYCNSLTLSLKKRDKNVTIQLLSLLRQY